MSQFVRKPPPYSMPGDCVLFPGRLTDDAGWVDPSREYDGVRGPIHPMISAEGFRQTALKHPQLRLVDADTATLAVERADASQKLLTEALAHIADLEDQIAAIAGLRRAGFTVQRIKGPRPKETT